MLLALKTSPKVQNRPFPEIRRQFFVSVHLAITFPNQPNKKTRIILIARGDFTSTMKIAKRSLPFSRPQSKQRRGCSRPMHFRIEFYGPVVVGKRPIQITLLPFCIAAVIIAQRVFGIEFYGPVVVRKRPIQITLIVFRGAAIAVGVLVFGIEFYGPVVVCDRPIQITLLPFCIAAVVVGPCVFRIEVLARL